MRAKKLKVVYSKSTDPWYNLSLEEYLLKGIKAGEVTLYLWQNNNTVVIGRNQNAWKECRYKKLTADGGSLARRLSGGGAVYHDLGNLNFTFIMDRELYDLKKQLEVILRAVREMGIEAYFSGRNDLIAADGRKFSGNAFYFSGQGAYHHGTILVDTNFTKLVTFLQISSEKIKSKGIESVRSRVINLKELNKDLTINRMKEAMVESFKSSYIDSLNEGKGELEVQQVDPEIEKKLKGLYQKYSSWEWCFGQTPGFDIAFENRFDWGGFEMGFSLKKGIIEKSIIYSDALDADLIQEMAASLEGTVLSLDEMINQLMTLQVNKEGKAIVSDVINWLKNRDI